MKRNLLIIFSAIILFSCQEEVVLPLATLDEEVPVIEAIWTDSRNYNGIKLTLAENYFDTTDVKVITDAEVKIRVTGTQKIIPFYFNKNSDDYQPINEFEVARIGETYEVLVNWNGNAYSAKGLMLEPPTVDSLTYSFQEKRIFRDEGYYIKVYGKIPFQNDNYYRIKVIVNDTLKNDRSDYLLFDDTFGLTFFEEGLELNYAFEEDDQVRLELFRMNEDAYNYFSQLVGLLYNDGGLFSPPPQNPDSNFKVDVGEGDVLGYFLVAPVLSEKVIIEEKEE